MIEAVEQEHPDFDEIELHNNISGLFIGFQGLGETLGPILGSTLQEFYGFRTSQDIIACGIVLFMLLFFLFCGRLRMFHSPSQKIDSQTSSIEMTDQKKNKKPE